MPLLQSLERNARLHEDVIRYMTIRVDEFEEGDSVVLRSRDRDSRAAATKIASNHVNAKKKLRETA